ncbi:COQ9 family protein [Paracoccus aminophilus]|uniref:COQ9 C-terminal domain-containing protein n=1 Tax=Paracoccus aminophilus JCM 7686 TaxID=1367847 RepID=S5XVW4_PARAH|nr:COQ9 family protein [Paracoccus aminophilus]AGT07530.1 hypothetical protein JCM7686_0421 [Paracoccus aminophilus JCM 7686]
MSIETEKERLIDAALSHAIFEGMNEAAIAAGARDLGLSPRLARVYLPRGGADLAAAYHRRGDQALAQWLANARPQGRFRDQITQAVLHRLEITDRELARAGAAVLALPQHAALGSKLLWETADVIWTGLGDRSEDINWYSKRTTLVAVYAATVLYWLGDDSEDHADTRRFLDRRIDGVMRFEKAKAFAAKLPGASRLGALATGWIRKPGGRDLPGHLNRNSPAAPAEGAQK